MAIYKALSERALDNFIKMTPQCQRLFFKFLTAPTHEVFDISTYVEATELDYSYCESPIEMMLAMALDFATLAMPTYSFVNFEPQVNVETASGKKYRLDFVLQDCEIENYKLVVECDGHDFHEKTKEQVAYGNQRDYDLKLMNYDILHFSGSQINANPLKIATEILNYIVSKERENGKH